MTVELDTDGLVKSCCQMDEIISYDQPSMQVLEVRPRIRRVTTPPAPDLIPPATVSAQEVKPETKDADGPALAPVTAPAQISSQEIKPVIKKITEE